MFFEVSINNWTTKINSFLDHKNLLATNSKKGFIKKEDDSFLGYAILLWSISYLIFEKRLHLCLRHKCFPLIQRNRIVSTIWDCLYSISTIIYLLYIFFQSSEIFMHPKLMSFTILSYKSFYIHHAGVNIFIHGLWMKGWSDLLFAFFAFNCHRRRLDPSIVLLLFLKVIDTTILVVCRLLLCFWNKRINQNFPKILFIFHCLTWTYIYLSFVPENVLWERKSKNLSENFYMWMWFISECLNSVWLGLFCKLEVYLFPPPSQDAIEFANRLKKQKASLFRKPSGQNTKKAELLKTLTCVMSVKKKLQRIRKAKEDKIDLQHKFETEEEKDEVDFDQNTKKKEIMQTLVCAMKVRKEIQKIRKEKRSSPETVTLDGNTETDFENNEIQGDEKLAETSV